MAGVIVRAVSACFCLFLLAFIGPPLYWGVVGRIPSRASYAATSASFNGGGRTADVSLLAVGGLNAAAGTAGEHGDLGGLSASPDLIDATDDGDDGASVATRAAGGLADTDTAHEHEAVAVDAQGDAGPAHVEEAAAHAVEPAARADPVAGQEFPVETPPNAPAPFEPITPPVQPPVRSEDYQLTRERVAQFASPEGVIMVTWANFHYLDFTMNWLGHLSRLGVKNLMVGAMDHEMLEALVSRGVPTFSMESGLTTGDFGWGTPTFHKMGREKISLFVKFTSMGFDTLISDVDTVWLRDPLPYMAEYKNADVLTSSDHLSKTTDDGGLEMWPNAASAANIGIMLFRRTASALAKEWLQMLEKDDKIWDQNAFNDLFRKGSMGGSGKSDNRVFRGYGGKLSFGILPVSLFCSGHTYFTQQMPMKMGVTPYVVHATFQYSGTDGKRHRFREHMMWDDPIEYYTFPGGYLVYDAHIPQDLIDNAKQSPEAHFELVNHQLLSIRSALALAQITGRALIMPKLWCGQDRWWAPHRGIIPGSQLKLPYECPLDHVLDVEWLNRERPKDAFGPHIHFREYSFLENPRLPVAVKASTNIMRFNDPQESGGAGGAVMSEDEFKAVHDTHHIGAKVLRLDSNANQFFYRYEDARAREKFELRLREYASIWCCKHAHPGHVWYDFLFDVPHVDRHNRKWDESNPWKVVTGP